MKLEREVEVKNPVGQPKVVPFYVSLIAAALAVGAMTAMMLTAVIYMADDRFTSQSVGAGSFSTPVEIPKYECAALSGPMIGCGIISTTGSTVLSGMNSTIIVVDEYK